MGLLDGWFGPPKPDKFANMLAAALRDAGDTREYVYEPDEFRLVFSENGQPAGVTNLGNMYNQFCEAPRTERSGYLKTIVRAALSHFKMLPDDFEDASHDVQPKLWTRASFEKMRLRQMLDGGQSPDIPAQLIGEHLLAGPVYDLPESIRSLSNDELDGWGVSYYEIMEVARRNLEEMESTFAAIGDCLYASLTGDSYDASRILLTDLIRKMQVDGDYIAMIPNRDSLLITGSDDDDGLKMMLDIAEDQIQQPYSMLGTPLRLDCDEWIDWNPDASHPLYRRFRDMELQWLHAEYAEQKSLMDAINEQQQSPQFVATFSVVETESGELFSYCVWSDGVETMLPKTDRIMFFREGEDIVAGGAYDEVTAIVGNLMQPTEDYPARFHVSQFPDNAPLAAIGQI